MCWPMCGMPQPTQATPVQPARFEFGRTGSRSAVCRVTAEVLTPSGSEGLYASRDQLTEYQEDP